MTGRQRFISRLYAFSAVLRVPLSGSSRAGACRRRAPSSYSRRRCSSSWSSRLLGVRARIRVGHLACLRGVGARVPEARVQVLLVLIDRREVPD
eukprot:scaffold9317_cov76-Phaeocystis_antarctica.AAC.5